MTFESIERDDEPAEPVNRARVLLALLLLALPAAVLVVMGVQGT